ncbi:hypothetical protein UT300012_31270 [Paraclostridium bifermentans]
MEGYQPKKKVGMLHPKYKKIRPPRGSFGSNGVRVTTTENRRSLKDKLPPTPNKERMIDKPIQCHTCSNKDICKYQGDYLEQVVHIIDVYDGVFDLSCNHYRSIEVLKMKKTIYDLGINSEEWNRDLDLSNNVLKSVNVTDLDLK